MNHVVITNIKNKEEIEDLIKQNKEIDRTFYVKKDVKNEILADGYQLVIKGDLNFIKENI